MCSRCVSSLLVGKVHSADRLFAGVLISVHDGHGILDESHRLSLEFCMCDIYITVHGPHKGIR